jgi:hypothetical protein
VNLGSAYLQGAVEEWAEVLRLNPGRRGVAEQLERLRASGLLQSRGDQDGRHEPAEAGADQP